MKGEEDTDWEALLKLPIAGFSDDGRPIESPERMRRLMHHLRDKKKILSLHEENLSLSCGSCLHESAAAEYWGVKSSPSSAELSMVERDLKILRDLRVPLHFAHLSSGETIKLLEAARRENLPFSAELTPHHGLLSVDEVREWPVEKLAQFKVCPPVRSSSDRAALQAAFRSGLLDCFATDHAPHSRFEKELPIEGAMHGFSSIEWHFSLANELRLESQTDWAHFFRALAERPAELLGLQGRLGRLQETYEASFIVFDPHEVVKLEGGASLNDNGPWVGRRIRGKLFATYIRGTQVYEAH